MVFNPSGSGFLLRKRLTAESTQNKTKKNHKKVFIYLTSVSFGDIIFKHIENEPYSYGGIAQLGEHLPCKQGVSGSIPLISTNSI